jgi:hypothetical protein
MAESFSVQHTLMWAAIFSLGASQVHGFMSDCLQQGARVRPDAALAIF